MGTNVMRALLLTSASVAMVATAAPSIAYAQEASYQIDIPAQDMGDALRALGKATKQNIVFSGSVVKHKRSTAVHGRMSAVEALSRILAGSGLKLSRGSGGGLVVLGEPGSADAAGQDGDMAPGAVPEILVTGRRSLNADIPRTEDDIQPYVVFRQEDIRRSQTASVEDFLASRLPMLTGGVPGARTNTDGDNRSSFNLRGLGSDETLVLVNGRRRSNSTLVPRGGGFAQPDLNGIALSSIERIEVLPATASGIYGGGATAGVINIILKSGYVGADVAISYDNSFKGNSAAERIEFTAGITGNEGQTSLQISASYSKQNPLFARDRNFMQRARDLYVHNVGDSIVSPPLSETTNIRSADGSILMFDDGRSLGSAFTSVPTGYSGYSSDNGGGLLQNAGSYNFSISNGSQGLARSIINSPEIYSANLTVNHRFSDSIEAFADLSYSKNLGRYFNTRVLSSAFIPADSPTNPFSTAIQVRFDTPGISRTSTYESENRSAIVGLIAKIGGGWTGAFEYNLGRSRSRAEYTSNAIMDFAASNAISNGLINVLADTNIFAPDFSAFLYQSPTDLVGPFDVSSNVATLRVAGPLLDLPAGKLTLSAFVERNEQKSESAFSDARARNGGIVWTPARDSRVLTGYAELFVPLVGLKNGRPWLRELNFQLSARRDNYRSRSPSPSSAVVQGIDGPFPDLQYFSNKTTSTAYTVGAKYAPVGDLALRGSYSTGFLPASIEQIVPSFIPPILSFFDPKRNFELSPPVALTLNGNPNLDPERSRSWSAGIIFSPKAFKGFRVSIDYTRIRKTNEISFLGADEILLFEDLLGGRVTRAPLTAEDTAAGYTTGVITAIDYSRLNLAKTRVEAIDVNISYDFELGGSRFNIYARGTKQLKAGLQVTEDSDFIDRTGYLNGPLEWRGNFGMDWESGPWGVGWNAQYFDSYRIYPAGTSDFDKPFYAGPQGAEKIPSQMYHDFYISYTFGEAASGGRGVLAGTKLSLGVRNLFDKSPPVVASLDPELGYSPYGSGRLRSYSLTLRKSF